MSVNVLTEKNFRTEVLKSDRPVLVVFAAPWCGQAQFIHKSLGELSREMPDVKVCAVNSDEENILSQKFEIVNIPTFIVFKNGKITASHVGVGTKDEIKKLLS